MAAAVAEISVGSGSSGRGVKQTLNDCGVIVTPTLPFKLGRLAPSGSRMSNVCASDEKNRNNSMRARMSPRHFRRPTPKGMKYSGLRTLPSLSKNRLGLNSSGLCHNVGSMWTLLMSGTTWDPAGIL